MTCLPASALVTSTLFVVSILIKVHHPLLKKNSNITKAQRVRFRRQLLDWYDHQGRDLPWRVKGGRQDPYKVWLSEIMLQQTTVAAVGPYYQKFLKAWPTVKRLAKADLDDVLRAWAGLGYYSRARNLHKCARFIVEEYGGSFPETEEELLALPGVGPYTAAAIAAIAFDRPTNVVDGNVERVMARTFAVGEPLPGAKVRLKECAATLVDADRPGDYAQALMDLGATICTPRTPSCLLCPVSKSCEGRKQGIAADLPKKAKKKKIPTRRAAVFWLQRANGDVLLRRRPEKGLLGGMMEVPSSAWVEQAVLTEDVLEEAPHDTVWTEHDGLVRHTFTHFHLELTLYTAHLKSKGGKVEGQWVSLVTLNDHALPTVMRKVVQHALDALGV